MDYALPVILFVIGFVAALVARGSLKLGIGSRRQVKLPISDGAVRLDLLGRGSGESVEPVVESEKGMDAAAEAPASEPAKAVEGEKGRGQRLRPRRRR